MGFKILLYYLNSILSAFSLASMPCYPERTRMIFHDEIEGGVLKKYATPAKAIHQLPSVRLMTARCSFKSCTNKKRRAVLA